jgi:hypothetical protein
MSRRQSGVRGARAVYLGSDGLEARGPGNALARLRSTGRCCRRVAISQYPCQPSLVSRSARRRAVFSASACRGVLAFSFGIDFLCCLELLLSTPTAYLAP